MFDLIRTIGSVLIVMIVLFLAWRSARKSLPQRQAETIPLDLASLEAGSNDDAAELLSDEEINQLEAGPDLTDEVTSLIDGQGDDMAGLLRGWMSA